MKQYIELCQQVIDEGVWKKNRTGVDTLGIIGGHMQFDMADGFPAVTTKKLHWKPCFAEMLGFLRGYSNAADFRRLGCHVWDANANENEQWLANPYRQGEDDLGRIYGVQARGWESDQEWGGEIDQLRRVYDDLRQGIDNRREIVTHWNPSDMGRMALPPCHLLYQFGIQDGRLCLSMYQRSCDMPLGVPFNIAGYSWLLCIFAKITGLEPGVFNHFLHDIHVYGNQLDLLKMQIAREPMAKPTLKISDRIQTLSDLETIATVEDFNLEGYSHHPAINYPFAV